MHRSDQNTSVLDSAALPLVSILIPAYKAERWIGETIRSALAQTWPRTEIIVVVDGSPDGTSAAARKFESAGVRVIDQPNQGAAAARNNAFSLSQGDYIQWLDADDLLAPDKIEQQMALVQQGAGPRKLLSSAWGRFMHRPHRAQFKPTALWADLSPAEWLLRKMGENIFMQTATWLVSRELSEAAGLWDTRLLGDDDGEYFSRVLLASEGVLFVPESKVYYRTLPNNSLSYVGRSKKKIDAHWLAMKLHIEYLRSLDDSPRAHAACVQFLRDSMLFFYPDEEEILKEAESMAREFGGTLGVPALPRKYALIEKLFGWRAARSAGLRLQYWKWSFQNTLDEISARFDTPAGVSPEHAKQSRVGYGLSNSPEHLSSTN